MDFLKSKSLLYTRFVEKVGNNLVLISKLVSDTLSKQERVHEERLGSYRNEVSIPGPGNGVMGTLRADHISVIGKDQGTLVFKIWFSPEIIE